MAIRSISDREYNKFVEEEANISNENVSLLIAGKTATNIAKILKVASDGKLLVNASEAAIPVTDNNSSLTVDGSISIIGALPAGTNIIGSVYSAITTIGDGRKVVTTAGTREALATSTPCKRVTITAETDNTGIVVVGGSTCIAALATRRGIPLNAGDSYELEIDNLADIYLDVTVNGDGVTYTYFN